MGRKLAPVQLGDAVVFHDRVDGEERIREGVVIEATDQMVRILCEGRWVRRHPHQVIPIVKHRVRR